MTKVRKLCWAILEYIIVDGGSISAVAVIVMVAAVLIMGVVAILAFGSTLGLVCMYQLLSLRNRGCSYLSGFSRNLEFNNEINVFSVLVVMWCYSSLRLASTNNT